MHGEIVRCPTSHALTAVSLNDGEAEALPRAPAQAVADLLAPVLPVSGGAGERARLSRPHLTRPDRKLRPANRTGEQRGGLGSEAGALLRAALLDSTVEANAGERLKAGGALHRDAASGFATLARAVLTGLPLELVHAEEVAERLPAVAARPHFGSLRPRCATARGGAVKRPALRASWVDRVGCAALHAVMLDAGWLGLRLVGAGRRAVAKAGSDGLGAVTAAGVCHARERNISPCRA